MPRFIRNIKTDEIHYYDRTCRHKPDSKNQSRSFQAVDLSAAVKQAQADFKFARACTNCDQI